MRGASLALAVCAVLVVVLAGYCAARGLKKVRGQALIYAMACRRAGATGKRLVTVGDPQAPGTLNAWFGAGYDCGDLCVDIAGAPSCPPAKVAKASVQEWLAGQPDNSAVIFESEVLLYVPAPEMESTVRELVRVSGGDLFASHSNVVDLERYARTGARQPVRWGDVARMRLLSGPATHRAFVAFPPFHPYEWVPLAGDVRTHPPSTGYP